MAAAALSSELRCSVCIDIYDDPVTLPCGHSFCRRCITQAWDHQTKGDSRCPECKELYRKRPELKTNLRLLNIAKAFLCTPPDQKSGILCTYCDLPASMSCLQCETSMCEDHLRKHNKTVQHALIPPTGSVRDRKCPIHKKILDLYCTEDSACLCASCRMDEEHRGHQVESLEEASEKKKEKLRDVLEMMTSRRDEAEEEVRRLQGKKRDLQGKAADVTERVSALFRDIRRQLEELEKKVLSEISKQMQKTSLTISNLLRQLETKRVNLSTKMRHIEKLITSTDPMTVLQDRDSSSGDFAEAEDTDDHHHQPNNCPTRPGPGPDMITTTDPRTVLQDQDSSRGDFAEDGGDVEGLTFSDMLIAGLSDIMKCANILFYINDPSDISLDLNTAATNLKILPTMRMVRWSHRDQNPPQVPARFEKYQVLSSQIFSSGCHYWDVETSRSGGWGIGVCYPSIERRGDQSIIGENSASWCLRRLCLWRWYKQYSARHDEHIIQLPQHITGDRIRVYLDYEAGHISFYDLGDPIQHLHTFNTSFTQPLHAAFYVWGDWWYKDSWLRIHSPAHSPSAESDWVDSRSMGVQQ